MLLGRPRAKIFCDHVLRTLRHSRRASSVCTMRISSLPLATDSLAANVGRVGLWEKSVLVFASPPDAFRDISARAERGPAPGVESVELWVGVDWQNLGWPLRKGAVARRAQP